MIPSEYVQMPPHRPPSILSTEAIVVLTQDVETSSVEGGFLRKFHLTDRRQRGVVGDVST